MSTVKRECQVVMLPTKKASRLYITPFDKTLRQSSIEYKQESFPSYKNQHLYILSDENIKEGDWVVFRGKEILKCGSDEHAGLGFEKIIATTDSSLELPQPSEGFIQKYIEAYNNGKPIEKVMVEYEKVFYSGFNFEYTPKINPKDNTITISKVKDSWTREEMVDFAWKTLVQGRKASTSMKDLFNELPEWFDKWVEKNL